MASYNPPTENITQFNTSLFNQPEEILSQAEADTLYLSKKNTDTSTAPLTTFNGQVVATNLDVGFNGAGGMNMRGGGRVYDISAPYQYFLQLYVQGTGMNYVMNNNGAAVGTTHNFTAFDTGIISRMAFRIGYFNVDVIDGINLNARLIKSTTPASASHTLFDNMTTGGVLTIGNSASSNTINGTTTFPHRTTFGTDGVNTTPANFRTDLRIFDIASPYTSFGQIYASASTLTYIMNAGPTTASQHIFTTYTASNASRDALKIGSTEVTILDNHFLNARLIKSSFPASGSHTLFDNMTSGAILTIGNSASTNTISGGTTFTQGVTLNAALTSFNRINHSNSTYTFPFASSQSLGYYLKTTGTGTSVVTATPTTILTTASIPIGVWRVDFSVTNTVGAAGAGTITQSQSFVSTTNNGAVATAVDFTGSVVRSHVSEVYGNNDVQEITSSFTYQQSTAGVLYLNIVRSFSTGTYLFTGELAVTRIA